MKTNLLLFFTLLNVNAFAGDPCNSMSTINGCGSNNAVSWSTGSLSTLWLFTAPGDWTVAGCDGSEDGKEGIFKFVAPTTGIYNISISNITKTISAISYYWSSSSCLSTGWNCIETMVNSTDTYGSMSWTAGNTYYILLKGYQAGTDATQHTFYLNCPPTLPNLIANGICLGVSGNSISISVEVKNIGDGNSDLSSIGFYASTDATITSTDYLLTGLFVWGLPPGGTEANSKTIDLCLESGLPNGTYYIGFIADYDETLSETNDNDNDGIFSSQIVIKNCSSSCSTPIAPSNLIATARLNASEFIDLTWSDNSSNEAGFEIESSTTSASSGFNKIDTKFANTTSMTVYASASEGTQYWFRVRAYCDLSYSPYSNSATATTPASSSAPGAFTLTLTPECDGTVSQIRLNWTSSSVATSYDVYRNGSIYYSNLTGNQFINVSNLTIGNSYSYYVKAKNSAGNTNNSNGTLSAIAPTCSNPPGSFNLYLTPECDGSNGQIRLNWDPSSGATSYDVYRNGGLYYSNVSGTQFINTNNLTINTTYNYYVKAKNNVGNTDNSNGTLSETPPDCNFCIAPSITAQPNNQPVNAPNGASFSISASGSNNLYYWQFNNGSSWSDIPGETSATLNITSSSSNINGYQYRCIVTSTCTSSMAVSNSATLFVNSGCTYSLSVASQNFSENAGTNSLSVISQDGCAWSASTNETWITLITNSGSGNGSVTYSVAYNSGDSRLGYIYIQGMTFTVNQTGFTCIIPQVPLGSGNSGNQICPGTNYSTEGGTSIGVSWVKTDAFYYDIEIREYPFENNNIIIAQQCIPVNNLQMLQYFSVNLPTSVAGKMFAWRVRGSNDCNTCYSDYSPFYYFNYRPNISPSGESGPTYICNGTGLTISTPVITVPYPGTVQYQWYKGLNINPTPVGYNSPEYFATESGNYYVRLIYSGSSLCNNPDTSQQSLYTTVYISTNPDAPVLSNDTSVCAGRTLKLKASAPSGSGYYWSGPNNFYQTGPDIFFSTIDTNNSGTYFCYVIKDECQSPTSSVNVSVLPSPVASFTYNLTENTVSFSNSSVNANSYLWNFGDGDTSTLSEPNHSYVNGTFISCLTAEREGCNSSSYCSLIQIGSGSQVTSLSTFSKLFNDTSSNHKEWHIYDFVQSSVDSGYILFGMYRDIINSMSTFQYFKTDKNGNLVWVRELPPNMWGFPSFIIKSHNGYLLGGSYNSWYLMEIDEQGNKLWSKQYSGDLQKMQMVSSGGYIGFSSSQDNKFIVVKVDNSGNIIWQNEHSYDLYTSTLIQINRFLQDNNGNCYLFGWIGNGQVLPSVHSFDGFIAKTDSTGNHQWSRYYSTPVPIGDNFTSAVEDANNDILLSGYSSNYSTNILNGLLFKISSGGNLILAKEISDGSISHLSRTSSNSIVGLYDGSEYSITEFNSNLGISNFKTEKLKSVNSFKTTYDNKFASAGRYPLNSATGQHRYNLFKFSFTDSLCIDTVSSQPTINNLSITLSNISPSNSTTSSITDSSLNIVPVLSFIKDSSICHICNLSASTSPNGNTTFCSGDSIMVFANAGMTSYQWSNGDSVQNISVNSSGYYWVTVTDVNGCTAVSQPLYVSVSPLPVAQAGNDVIICSGSDASIGSFSLLNHTYSWMPSTGLSYASVSDPKAYPDSTTTYYVTITNTSGCTLTDSVKVTVNSLPMVDAGKDTIITQGSSVSIGGNPTAVGNSPFLYKWTPLFEINSDSLANPVVSPQSTTNYTVEVTDSNGCINSDFVMVTVEPITCAYTLSDSSYTFSNNGGSHVITLTPSNVACTWQITGSISWLQISPVNLQIGNGSVTINADSCIGGTPRNDSFIVAGVKYYVSQNCSTETTCNSFISPGGSTAFCSGDSVTLTANAGMANYLWNTGQSTQSINVKNPGSYSVSITDSTGCVAISDTMMVTVYSLPLIDAGKDTIINQGNTIILGGNPTASGSEPFSYIWSPVTGLSSDSVSNPMASPIVSASYTVSVVDLNGCSNSDNIIITVNPPCTLPDVDFAASQTTGNCPFNVDFYDLSLTSGSVAYEWTIYNGSGSPVISDLQNPTGILYNVEGSFLVKLKVTDSCGTNMKFSPDYIKVDCPTSNSENILLNNLLIFPNPVKDEMIIVASNIKGNTLKINLKNLLGQVVFSKWINVTDISLEERIPLSELSDGLYYLTVQYDNEFYVVKISKVK